MGIFGHRTVAAAVQRRMRKTACLVMWEGAGRNRQRATDCFAGGSQPATNKANKIYYWKNAVLYVKLSPLLIMDVKLPKLGEGADSGVVVNIFVKEGDAIARDQAILELENEKAVASIPSTAAGVVTKIYVKPGDKIGVGQRLISLSGGDQPAAAAAPAAKRPRRKRSRKRRPKNRRPRPGRKFQAGGRAGRVAIHSPAGARTRH